MNGRRRFLTASVISVQNSNFVYPSCQNCFSRLYIDLKRYGCLKCGCSGDAREASYRYRLSLEVADAHEVFLVTVFGSCLEAFFGVTAKSLQRYIEDLNPEAIRDASPSVVIQAVKNCFVGKKFVFGVKESEKQDGAARLQDCSTVDRYPKALTACQMFVPNPGFVGCTVIHYLHQHRHSSSSEGIHGGVWSPGGLFAALDLPSSDVSCLDSSGNSDAVPSQHTGCLSSLWPQSFGLTSSSISGGTAVDSTALGSGRAARDEQKWDESPVSLQHHNQSASDSEDDNLTINERKVQEDKFCLCSTRCDSIIVKKDTQSHAERGGDRSLQNPLEIRKKDSPGIWCSRGLEKSPNPVMCQKQDYSFCPLALCTSRSRGGGCSQDDLWFWDELPSSESLTEFIARIDNGKAVVWSAEAGVQGLFTSKGAGEIHEHINRSPLQLDSSTAVQAHEKLQEVDEKVDGPKEPFLDHHRSNWLAFRDEEYPQKAASSSVSTQGKDEWERLSIHHQVLLPQPSSAGIKPSGSEGSCLSFKEGVDWAVTGCENHCTLSSLKTAGSFFQSPAHLNHKHGGHVTSWKRKGSSCHEQTSDPTDVQEQGFTLAAREKLDKVSGRELFPEVHQNHCRGGEISHFLQGSSICSQGSYSASVDLFDASAAGEEADIGIMSTAQTLPAQGGILPTESLASGCNPSKLEASWNPTQSGLSSLDLVTTCDPKASPPLAGPAFESENSLLNSQDFVPSSQSTPHVRTCQQASFPRGKESILSELPLNKRPWSNARWKRPRPAFKTPLVKQLISKFLQSRRSSNMSSAAMDTSATQGWFTNRSPAQELSGGNGEEWIPPSEKKNIQPLPFQKQEMFRSRRSRDVMGKVSFSEMGTRREIPRATIGLAIAGFAPESQQPTEATLHEDGAAPEQVTVESPGFCTFSEGDRLSLSSTSKMVNWSPELFGDNSQLLTAEATL